MEFDFIELLGYVATFFVAASFIQIHYSLKSCKYPLGQYSLLFTV